MNITNRLLTYALSLECGCTPLYRIAPPGKGDTITCIRHGAVKVLGRKVVKKSGDTTDNASGCDNTSVVVR